MTEKEHSSGKGVVLVIDDNEKCGNSIARILTRRGYEVLCTTSPQEGLKIAHQTTPGVVLTDTIMPEIDGCQVVQRIRERGRGTQVIVMTGYIEPLKILEAYIAGASDFISKPPKAEEILDAVERGMLSYNRWRSLVCLFAKERGKNTQIEEMEQPE